jgi:DNA-binding transcriptional LysR family regulator
VTAAGPVGSSAGTRNLALGLSAVDLNLLFVLHVVLEEGSVVRAAVRLCLTPSAVSNALARVRAALGDALLVREGKRLVPTSRALQIQPVLAIAVRSLEAALRVDQAFDPTTVDRRWTIGASDYSGAVLLPPLVAALRERAPRGSIRVTPIETALSGRALQLGNASLLIGRFPTPPDGCRVADLWNDEAVTIARLGHPHIRGRLTMEASAASPHVLTSPIDGTMGHVDRAMSELSPARTAGLLVPHFVLVPLVVSSTDHIATIPRRLAERFAPLLGLQVLEPPCAIDAIKVQAMWHQRTDDDPAEAFLRTTIVELVRDCISVAAPTPPPGDGGDETPARKLGPLTARSAVG